MSKQSILTAIRRGLKRGALPPDQAAMLGGRLVQHPRHLIPARSRLPEAAQIELFVRNVEREFGSVVRVADLDEVPGVVVDYLAAQNLPGRVVMAPHPELQAIPWSARPLLEVREGRAQGSDAVSVQHGFAGIAETGTLMLPSAPERGSRLAARFGQNQLDVTDRFPAQRAWQRRLLDGYTCHPIRQKHFNARFIATRGLARCGRRVD